MAHRAASALTKKGTTKYRGKRGDRRQKVGKYSGSEGQAVDLFQRQNAKKHKFILHVQPIAVTGEAGGKGGGGARTTRSEEQNDDLKVPIKRNIRDWCPVPGCPYRLVC